MYYIINLGRDATFILEEDKLSLDEIQDLFSLFYYSEFDIMGYCKDITIICGKINIAGLISPLWFVHTKYSHDKCDTCGQEISDKPQQISYEIDKSYLGKIPEKYFDRLFGLWKSYPNDKPMVEFLEKNKEVFLKKD